MAAVVTAFLAAAAALASAIAILLGFQVFWVHAALAVVFVWGAAGGGWQDRRTGEEFAVDRGRIMIMGLVSFAFAVVLLAGLATVDDAGIVRDGNIPDTLYHPLVGGPVTCVEPKPAPASTRYLLHLGTGDTHEVLFWPGHGPVRVPSGDVVLLPAEPSKCRPSD